MMRLLLRINRMLRMLHLLPSHLSMFHSPILRRIQRTMTTRTLRRILLIISPMEEMTVMTEGSSEDDEDDDMDIEADKEEEEEHPAPTDSVVVASTAADQAPSAKETEPFETDESAATLPPHPAYRMTARISIPAPLPMPDWSDSEVVRLLAMSSPPASPLSHWEDRLEVTLPPQKRLGITLGPGYEVGDSSYAAAARPAGGLRADY
nr:hypothetical protein [Tanacetum cinerariifolium]